jgi:protein TonB
VNLRSLSPLHLALGISIAVHAAVLTVRFVSPEIFNRVFKDTPLEVVLVNAQTDEKTTDKAQAIAQTHMAGGGDNTAGRTTSPLPFMLHSDSGETLEDKSQKTQNQMKQQQTVLLALVRKQIAALPVTDPQNPANTAEQIAQEEKRRQLVKLLAEIERRINEENARPRKRYIGPSTREQAYAVYYDRLRRSIEDKGTDNFPEAGGKKLYGELTMMVTVNHDGSLLATHIVNSSGNRTLDLRAEAIARSAAPFGKFNEAMRRRADQIVVVSRFKFTRDETLETRVSTHSGKAP